MMTKQIEKVLKTIQRFPLSFISSLLAFALAVAQTKSGLLYHAPMRESFIKGQVISIIAFFLLYTWRLLVENLKLQKIQYFVGLGSIALFLVGFYFFLLSPVFELEVGQFSYISRQAMLYLSIVIGILWLPFFKNGAKNNALWRYIINLANNIAQAMAMSFVLMLGIFAIFATIDTLFGIRIDSKLYFRVFLLLSHVIAPLYVMFQTPKNMPQANKLIHLKGLATFMSKYILVPLISVYALVVYIYLLKTIITLSWPKYGVAELISGFIIVGIITYFFTYPARGKKNLIGLFHKYFFMFILPMIVALWAGIGVRITEYGFSVNRYLIVIFGLYSLSLVTHYTFSKKKNLQVIFINLLLFIFISGFVPFVNAFAVTRNSQIKQLDKFIVEGNIYQARSALDSIIDVSSARYLKKKYRSLINPDKTREQVIDDFLSKKGLKKPITSKSPFKNYNKHDFFEYHSYDDTQTLNIEGYKSLVQFNLVDFTNFKENMFTPPSSDPDEQEIQLNQTLTAMNLQNNTLSLDGYFQEDLSELIDIAQANSSKQNFDEERTALKIIGDDYMVIIKDLDGEINNGIATITTLDGYLLLK